MAIQRGPAPSPPARPPGQANTPVPVPRNPFRSWRFWITLGILLIVNIFVTNVLFAPAQPTTITIPYNIFKQQVADDNVVSVTTTGDTINAKPENPPPPLWQTLLLSFGPTLLLVFGFIYLIRRAQSAGGAGGLLGSFGQSRARLYDPERPATTFADVAGIDEVKQELQELVDFLREPQKYEKLGGSVPKGVLLIGPPGTGKTLLARAVAGEAKVPFFSQSASEFVEAIVGVGASRVRDLFTKARSAAPAIIFIDELDAIGRSRSSGFRIGGNDEQEQTLNQILTEMDGFEPGKGVIVLAATNRADVLDAALLRPGRFDRRVTLQPPDRRGRTEI